MLFYVMIHCTPYGYNLLLGQVTASYAKRWYLQWKAMEYLGDSDQRTGDGTDACWFCEEE